MRKEASYVKEYGSKIGKKLYKLLQQEANKASQVAKFKKKHKI
jgi:hypothetical protein